MDRTYPLITLMFTKENTKQSVFYLFRIQLRNSYNLFGKNKFAQKINSEAYAERDCAFAQAVFVGKAVGHPRFVGEDCRAVSADEMRKINDAFAGFGARRVAADERVFQAFAEIFLPAFLETVFEFESFGDAERNGIANGVGRVA